MIPTTFDNQNYIISGGESGIDVPVRVEDGTIISCWMANKEELEEINKTGLIWIYSDQPPERKLWLPIRPSGTNPFVKANPLIVDERIQLRARVLFPENEEIILLDIKEGEENFTVVTNDNIWYHLEYSVSGEQSRRTGEYSFKHKVTVVGRGDHCIEYKWLFDKYKIDSRRVLVLKRN